MHGEKGRRIPKSERKSQNPKKEVQRMRKGKTELKRQDGMDQVQSEFG